MPLGLKSRKGEFAKKSVLSKLDYSLCDLLLTVIAPHLKILMNNQATVFL